jgi:predicted nucleotidyltransferase
MEAVKKIAPNIDISLLDSPNNILGIEYLKALIHLNSSIRPITITRRAADYHDEELSQNKESVISSASAIRKSCRENDTIVLLNNHVPEPVYHILKEKYLKTYPIFEDDCSLIMNYKLLQESKQSLSEYIDVTDELANRINHINAAGMTFSQLALTIKTKQWTLTRINRALIHILLNLYNKNFTAYNNAGYTQYARLLGLNKTVSPVLRSIASKGTIPVITKMADAKLLISEPGINMLNEDILAANIYNEIVHHKYKCLLKDEYRQGIILYNK